MMVILLVWLITVEYLQIRGYGEGKFCSGLKEHFLDKSNWIDLFQLGSTIWLVFIHYTSMEPHDRLSQRIVAIFAMFFLWAKFFEWMNIFQATSFYVRLVIETIDDVYPFLSLYFISLFWFGSTLWILQINTISEEDDDQIIPETFGYFFIDKLYNQYMFSLGDWSIDGFENHPQGVLCYIFFLLATIFTQLIIFNMLMGIMGDTFGRVMESRDIYALQMKLQIMSKYSSVI